MNRPKYETLWKRSATGKVKSYKVEVKRTTLYCRSCHRDKRVTKFFNESGYGTDTTNKTICLICYNKHLLRDEKVRARLDAKNKTITQQVVEHYGGYKCVGSMYKGSRCVGDLAITDPRLLKLYHHAGKDRHYRVAALGLRYCNHIRNYHFWLKTHGYPSQHRQVVLCLHCHVLAPVPTRVKPLRKCRKKRSRQLRPVALSDKDKMLEMFGVTEADLKESD
ncbi:hypothetical protein LCGC14_1904800 [marine sediment metagenome]|uniref:Uncharacterized protein n=1 Tax=marine sediment metagenome TaxID=412755 RepID=A0A0F9FVF6_9ZZZZ